jgi:hypothetical protein
VQFLNFSVLPTTLSFGEMTTYKMVIKLTAQLLYVTKNSREFRRKIETIFFDYRKKVGLMGQER